MRILQVIPAFYPAEGYGGGPRVAFEISKRLADRGHSVTVFTTDARDERTRFDISTEFNKGLTVVRFKNISNSLAYRYKMFISPGIIFAALRGIRGYDIVHLHDTRTFQNAIVAGAAIVARVPFVVQPHGTLSYQGKARKKSKSLLDIIFGVQMLKRADAILALNVSEGEKCRHLGVNAHRIAVIPNGIDLAPYRRLPDKGGFRETYDIDRDCTVVLYLGRLHKSKDIEFLIQAFGEVKSADSRIKLVLVGPDDGSMNVLKETAKSLRIEDRVLFTGPIDEKLKAAAYVDADVFVTPSFYGFPLTFLEAMACGCPIVTTNKGDFIEGMNSQFGLVTDYRKDGLVSALNTILTDHDLREALGSRGRDIVREYDWDNIVTEIEEVYRRASENEP